jgi:hypothetical protein
MKYCYFFRGKDSFGDLISEGMVEADTLIHALKKAYLTDEDIIHTVQQRHHIDTIYMREMVARGLSSTDEDERDTFYGDLLHDFQVFLLGNDSEFRDLEDIDDLYDLLDERGDGFLNGLAPYVNVERAGDFKDLDALMPLFKRHHRYQAFCTRDLDPRDLDEETLEYLIAIDLKNGIVSALDEPTYQLIKNRINL